jgi:hypothetical protein
MNHSYGLTLQQRIDKYSKLVPETGCLEWQAGKDRDGYAKIAVYEGVKHKNKTVTRLVWEAANGQIPDGYLVCHECDNTSCVNLKHLFLGTDQDNVTDKVNKGRCLPCTGEMNGRAKLTTEQVRAIRIGKGTISALARKYDVSRPTIKRIKDGKAWSSIV